MKRAPLAAGINLDLEWSTSCCERRWVFSSRPHIWGFRSGAGSTAQFRQELLSAIFPDDCHLCGLPLRAFDPFPVCPACIGRVRPIEADCFCERCGTPFLNEFALNEDGICRLCLTGRRGFDACFVYGSYENELRDLIHLFKYGRMESLAPLLAERMLSALPPDRKQPGRMADCVVPVPMHWWKRWRRGFNQAERLARDLSRRLSIPLVQPLRRPKPARVQAGLSSAARRKNALNSFAFRNSPALAGRRVLLVDDVFTTGATATACSRLLKQAGAATVDFLALARVDRRAPAAFPRAGEAPRPRIGEPDGAGGNELLGEAFSFENREMKWE